MSCPTSLDNLESLVRAVIDDAVRASGCSEVIFERNVHQGLVRLILRAQPGQREGVESQLSALHGFSPGGPVFEFEAGECTLTGIAKDCCPCGNHE